MITYWDCLASSMSRTGNCQSFQLFLKDDQYCSSNNARSYEIPSLPVTSVNATFMKPKLF